MQAPWPTLKPQSQIDYTQYVQYTAIAYTASPHWALHVHVHVQYMQHVHVCMIAWAYYAIADHKKPARVGSSNLKQVYT